MKTTQMILTGILALASVPLLSAKSYDVHFDSATKAGALSLAPGDYTVKLVGTSAVFTSEDSGKKFTAPVTLKDASRKHENTAVETHETGGIQHLDAIYLGGSATELVFGK